MTYSRKLDRERAIDLAVASEKLKAIKDYVSDFSVAHPDEKRDAALGKFTLLTKRVKEKMEKHQALAIQRRNKRK